MAKIFDVTGIRISSSNELNKFVSKLFSERIMNKKTIRLIIVLVALSFTIVSCKRDIEINMENEARLKIEKTNWAAYYGTSWSQGTGKVELTPDQFVLIRAKIPSSGISLQFKNTSWKDFQIEFVQYAQRLGEYQFRIRDTPYSYAEFYVNENGDELRIYIHERSNSSKTYQIFFKKV